MADEKFGPIGNDRYRDYLRDINRSGNHVLALVNDLLDISRSKRARSICSSRRFRSTMPLAKRLR